MILSPTRSRIRDRGIKHCAFLWPVSAVVKPKQACRSVTSVDSISALEVAAAAAQLAGLAVSVSNNLMPFIISVQSAPKKSRELTSLVSCILEDLKTLEIMQSTERSLKNDTVDGFVGLLKEMTTRIEVRESDIRRRLKWPFTEKQNKEYPEKAESFRNTFNFALNTLQTYLLFEDL